MSTRPRLCFVVTNAITATTFLPGYLSFLREDGWDVILVCSDGPGLLELATAEGVLVQRVPMKREPSPLSDLRSLFMMFVVLRRLRPDVLVYATPKASLLASIAGWLAGVPRRVYELWGLRLETATGFSRRTFHALEWITAKLSNIVIANSRSLADRAQELGVSAGTQIMVLGAGSSHGVDSARFSREAEMPSLDQRTAEALRAHDVPVVGFIGRLHPDKGIDVLLEALRLCGERGVGVQALIIGGDEGADFAKLMDVVRETVPVHLAGYIGDPRPYLTAIDMIVLPSLREGFPNVILEAAAMRVPAIVSDATGCIDAVQEGLTGIVVPVGNSLLLAEAIETLVIDPKYARKLGASARSRVLSEYAPQMVWGAHSSAWRIGENDNERV